MPRLKQNLSIFEKWELKKKGKRDGQAGKFEVTEVVVDGKDKTIYHSAVVMEELAKFIRVRNQIYSSFQFDHKSNTFRELINQIQRENSELEMSLGYMINVDTKNYRTASRELQNAQLDEDRKKLHDLTINNLESRVYTETLSHYGKMILNLEEEVRLLEAVYTVVSDHFNRYLARISYYWHHGSLYMEELPAVSPSEWELLALRRETRFGEMDQLLTQRRSEIKWYQAKKDQLVPEGIIEYFLTNGQMNDHKRRGHDA